MAWIDRFTGHLQSRNINENVNENENINTNVNEYRIKREGPLSATWQRAVVSKDRSVPQKGRFSRFDTLGK